MANAATTAAASAVAADGTAVEIYRRLPSLGEVEHISSVLAPNSSVLDLGAGTGRIADPLTALGHRVTATTIPPKCWRTSVTLERFSPVSRICDCPSDSTRCCWSATC